MSQLTADTESASKLIFVTKIVNGMDIPILYIVSKTEKGEIVLFLID